MPGAVEYRKETKRGTGAWRPHARGEGANAWERPFDTPSVTVARKKGNEATRSAEGKEMKACRVTAEQNEDEDREEREV